MKHWLKQFINDQIHMTEGERLVNYWYVWLLVIIIACCIVLYRRREQK